MSLTWFGTDPREIAATQRDCVGDACIPDGNIATWNRGCEVNMPGIDYCYIPLSPAGRLQGCLAGIERHCTP